MFSGDEASFGGEVVFGFFWFTIFPSVYLHLNSDRDKSGTAFFSSKVLRPRLRKSVNTGALSSTHHPTILGI